ncbi:hypothetical protein SAMN05518672_103198 [Chitinophaga sp. CF118]|uniref:hypothetical protein n=1 Tax=Chitinophaga sp. CF118 TaxID=1884367 RepID=UPI0008F3A6F2|nr:hypothetical protein [Chitinophaga sp. CF118]SFD78271.1 hypothetical protein SAMN05518672_103198 [Chitinophaga sp. CF118]
MFKTLKAEGNNGVTTLATDIAGQPWLPEYAFGKGVNAVTGNLAGTAVVIPAVKPATGQSSITTYSSITSSSDVEKQISASADGSYNMDGMTVSASTSYLTEIKQSELYMTVIATFESSSNGYDTVSYPGTSITLTEQARALVDKGDFATFRNIYGDYLISGSKKCAYFRAIFTLHTTSESDLQKLEASIGADVPEIFTAKGNTAFQEAIKQSNASVNMTLNMQGYSGNPPSGKWDISTVSEALTWFTAHMAPIEVLTEMIHYSIVDSRIPTTLNIDPSIFSAVSDIYLNAYMLDISWASLPDEWQYIYEVQVTSLVKQVRFSAQELVTNDSLRATLYSEVTQLLSTLQNLYQRVVFIKRIKSLQPGEPAIGQSESGTQLYGSTNYPNKANDPAFKIQYVSQNFKETGHVGHKYHTFYIAPDNGIIIQWELHAVWTDGTDGTWYLEQQNNNMSHILLNNAAKITAVSELSRGFDNTLTVWYVDASLIPASLF